MHGMQGHMTARARFTIMYICMWNNKGLGLIGDISNSYCMASWALAYINFIARDRVTIEGECNKEPIMPS